MTGSVYLDACMIIDLVEGRPDQQERLSNALKDRTLISSELARLESRIGALRARKTEYLETYRRFFDNCRMREKGPREKGPGSISARFLLISAYAPAYTRSHRRSAVAHRAAGPQSRRLFFR